MKIKGASCIKGARSGYAKLHASFVKIRDKKLFLNRKKRCQGCFATRLLIALFSIFFKHESNIFLYFFKVSLAINQLSFIIFVKVTICKNFLNLIQEKEASRSIYSSDNTLTMSAKQPYPHPNYIPLASFNTS